MPSTTPTANPGGQDPLAGINVNGQVPTSEDQQSGLIGVPSAKKGSNGKPVNYAPPRTAHYHHAPGSHDQGDTWQTYTNALGTPYQPPQYVNGDELDPVNDPAKIPQLQAQLVAAGLLNPQEVRWGLWDSNSQSAYKSVLAFANQQGMSKEDALKFFAENPKAGDTTKNAPAPEKIHNPADARAAFRQAAANIIGHGLPKSEEDAFATYYQQQEQNAYKQYASAYTNNQSTTVPSAPDIGTAAEDYIRQQNPQDAVAYGAASRMVDFFDMLKGP